MPEWRSWLRYYLPFNDTKNVAKDICGNTWVVEGTPSIVNSNTYPGKTLCKLKTGDSLKIDPSSVSTANPFFGYSRIFIDTNVVYYYIVHFWMTYGGYEVLDQRNAYVYVNFNNKNPDISNDPYPSISFICYPNFYQLSYAMRTSSNTTRFIQVVPSTSGTITKDSWIENLSKIAEGAITTDPDGKKLVHVFIIYPDFARTSDTIGGYERFGTTLLYNRNGVSIGNCSVLVNSYKYINSPLTRSTLDTTYNMYFYYHTYKYSVKYNTIPTITICNNIEDFNFYIGHFTMIGPIIVDEAKEMIKLLLKRSHFSDINSYSFEYENMITL